MATRSTLLGSCCRSLACVPRPAVRAWRRPLSDAAPTKSMPHILADSIRASGPMTVATFMRSALLDPVQGYYSSSHDSADRNVIGSKGDFITSPEISQVFGELLAVFFVARWQAVDQPMATRLIELGPGRGTLLSDLVRTFSTFPLASSLRQIHLVETSDGLRRLQEDALRQIVEGRLGKKLIISPDVGALDEIHVQWYADVHSVPIQPDSWNMLVAHEFFDALPIHIFEKVKDGFREVLVDVKRRQPGVVILKGKEISASRSAQPEFQYVLSPTPTPWSMLLAARNPRFASLAVGQRVEISPEAWAVARRCGELISGREAALPPMPGGPEPEPRAESDAVGGAGLVIDYGGEQSYSASFRAFRNHQLVDPLIEPSSADLTANVDFVHLKHALASTDARSHGSMLQAHFLSALGLTQRVEALIRAAPDDKRRKEIQAAAMRLVDLTSMGKQYQVLGVDAAPAAAEPDLYPFSLQSMQAAPSQT